MLTGEPDAGDPHVRFGGRGGAIQCVVPTPITLGSYVILVRRMRRCGWERNRVAG